MLAANVDLHVVVDRQMAHTRHERQVEELGDLGSDLARVGIDGVAPGEHQIERAGAPQRGCQRGGRGQRVGTGERGVGHVQTVDVYAAFEAPRDRFSQGVVGGGRPEREDRDA